MPHIAVWDANGHRITQYKGNKNGHVGDGAGNTIGFSLDNNQNGGKPAKPEYVSVVMHEHDGICLASVVAASQGVQWVWTGDVGYTCGAQWYASKYTFDASNQPIHCVWLDADHGNSVIAKGLSLHMRDFSGEAGLLLQYQKNEGRLCQNSARMTFYPEILPDSIPEFFGPPLKYKRDESNGDPKKNATAGALEKPDQGLDRKTRAYPDGTDLNLHKNVRRQQVERFNARRKLCTRGVKNLNLDRLTVSHMPGHSAKELCADSMSLGPDFVSKDEGTYCDMETATLWLLCSIVQEMINRGVVDLPNLQRLLVHAVRYEHEPIFRMLIARGVSMHDQTTKAECVEAAEAEGLESMLALLTVPVIQAQNLS